MGRTNDEKLALLWARSQRSLRDVDVRLNRWETPNEFAERAAMAFPVVSRPVKSLAEALTEATYRPEGSAGSMCPARTVRADFVTAHWTRQIERAVTDSIGTASRVRRYFDAVALTGSGRTAEMFSEWRRRRRRSGVVR